MGATKEAVKGTVNNTANGTACNRPKPTRRKKRSTNNEKKTIRVACAGPGQKHYTFVLKGYTGKALCVLHSLEAIEANPDYPQYFRLVKRSGDTPTM